MLKTLKPDATITNKFGLVVVKYMVIVPLQNVYKKINLVK